MTKNAERIAERHAREMAEAIRLDAVSAALVIPPRLGCAHSDHVSAMYGGGYKEGEKHTAAATVRALIEAHAPVTCLRRRGTFMHSKPEDMFRPDNDGEDQGRHVVTLRLDGGKGFGPNLTARWWSDAGGERVHFQCELSPFAPGAPIMQRLSGRYDSAGYPVGFRWALNNTPAQACDVLSWAAGSPDCYHREVCFATVADFFAWLDSVPAPAVRS